MSATDIKPEVSFPDLRLAAVDISHGKHLPCWETARAIYHISLHLADSVPQDQLVAWRAERARLTAIAQQEGRPLSADEINVMREVFSQRVERYLSSGHGACLLKNPDAANALVGVLQHSNGTLYSLHEWCVMPNHVHIVVGGFAPTVSMSDILVIWKRASGHAINKVLSRSGEVWHKDAFTRIVRDETEYGRLVEYVWYNPEAAGLVDGFRRWCCWARTGRP